VIGGVIHSMQIGFCSTNEAFNF